jgi:peptidyl-prolyl cis-trans isomerase D
MLNSLRKGVSSIFIKAFLGLIILSFVVWGVADVFRGYGARDLVRVGSQTITPEQYQRAYEEEMNRAQMRFGQRPTRELARMLGLDGQVLTRLIGEAVIDEHSRSLKLGISDQAILDIVKRDPSFLTSDGQFKKETFAAALRANGLTEQGFFHTQRLTQTRVQLTDAILADPIAPAATVAALNRYREETRTIAYIVVPEDKAAKVADPSDDQLKAYHEANKRQFSHPETRKFAYLAIGPEQLKKPAEVAEADIKKAFEERKASFGTPEKRNIQLIAFPDLAAAEKGYKELKAGKDFLALAKELSLKDSDVNLGSQTKAQMIDKALAEAAFGLKKLEISQPVKGDFSIAIVRSTDITPGSQKTYDEVKNELRDALALDRATEEAQGLQDKVENARGRGANLKEAAEKAGFRLVEVAAADRQGKGPDGKPVLTIADADRVLAKVFSTDIGADAEIIELAGGTAAWVEVQAITPEKLKPLEEVKADVKTAWLAAERRKGLQGLTQKLSDRLGSGETLEAIAKELGVKAETTKPTKRADKPEGLPPAAVSLAFALPKGAAGHTDSGDGKGRIVLRVADIAAPSAPDEAATQRLSQELGRQINNDILAQYVGALQARYGVKINNELLQRITGGGSQ